MRKTAIIAGALCAAAFGCLGAEVPAPVVVEKGVLDPAGGHVQGFCASDDAFYFTQMKTLYKCDWSGKLLKKVPVVCHTGDICFWEGHVYTAVSVYQGPDKGKGIIQVFDADLNLVREAKLEKSTDGITVMVSRDKWNIPFVSIDFSLPADKSARLADVSKILAPWL